MSSTLSPGAIFAGDYRVVRPLSSGGMGAIYVVEQVSTGKARALKLMHPELVADPTLRRRFEQEARIGAKIPSDHVVEVQAAGVDAESGAPYLVMELLEGDDLAAVVAARGPLPPQEVGRLMEQLCHAVGAAHAAGIVHRDLKPENVFLARSRRTDVAFTVKVLDFGIAKLLSEQTTQKTAAIGSPLWLAPEQTERGPVTPAADVWALGLIAFDLLTGQPFWSSALAADATVTQVMREVLFEPIPLASARAAERGRRVPPAFDAWFARCVTREPRARFPDATQAWRALGAALGGPSASVVPPGAAVASGTAAVLAATQPVSAPPPMTPHPVTPHPVSPYVPASSPLAGTPAALSASAPVPRKGRAGAWLGLAGAALAMLAGGGWLLGTCVHRASRDWHLDRNVKDPRTGELVTVTEDRNGVHVDVPADGGAAHADVPRPGETRASAGEGESAHTAEPRTRTAPGATTATTTTTAAATAGPPPRTGVTPTYHRPPGEKTVSGMVAGAPTAWHGIDFFKAHLQRRLQACRDAVADGENGSIIVKVKLDASGKLDSAEEPVGTGSGAPGVDCMMRVIRTTHFPASAPPPEGVKVMVSWSE